MRKLSQEEINRLFDFTQKHYVEYYDLQIELVDHLACGIEEQWDEDESISFEDALNIEFKKFGIFGFSDIVDQRRQQLLKKYNKLIRQMMFKHLVKLEYIGILILSSILYFVGSYFFTKIAFITAMVFFYGLVIYFMIKLSTAYKNKVKETGKKILLLETIYKNFASLSLISAIFNIWIQSLIYIDFNWIYINVFFAIIIPILFLFIYISCHFLPKHSEEILEEMNPEYKLIKE